MGRPVSSRVCDVPGCGRKHTANGYCRTHNQRRYRLGDALANVPVREYDPTRGCEVEDCDREHDSKGLCTRHKQIRNVLGLQVKDISRLEKITACEVCGRDDVTLHMDHDHTTGLPRGRLCYNCNMALGLLKDDRERILALAAYIDR